MADTFDLNKKLKEINTKIIEYVNDLIANCDRRIVYYSFLIENYGNRHYSNDDRRIETLSIEEYARRKEKALDCRGTALMLRAERLKIKEN